MNPRILVVDDDPGVRYTIKEILESDNLEVYQAESGEKALSLLATQPVELVITDLRMPGMDGMALLRRLRVEPHPPRVLMITAHGSERLAVDAVKAGAYDYFKKPFEVEELLGVVRRAIEAVRLEQENERLQGERALSQSLVFVSPAMSRLAVLVQRVAPRDVTVLITGESGTGKERVAEALVSASARADKPFIRFNCASLTPELAEAELFGHAKGAFTGAHRERPGLFREADGGTLLLDEVGELEPGAQARLLRVLQVGELRPVGEERVRKVDVRILAATHRDLRELSQQGRFREDLYYRLNVVQLRVPPLRERPEDIPVLARLFFNRFAGRFGVQGLKLTPELMQRLQGASWPGNVRELENTLERLVALSHEGELDLSLLGEHAGHVQGGLGLRERVDAYERGLIMEALRASGGNQSEAARRLQVPRVTLHDKLRKYGLVEGDV